jgi:hypothetical protein
MIALSVKISKVEWCTPVVVKRAGFAGPLGVQIES